MTWWQGGRVARWQGDKVAGWQGGRVTGWQGGRVTWWQGDKVSGCQGGKLAGWQVGRVAGWQGGRVAGWQGGRVAGWKDYNVQTCDSLSRTALQRSTSVNACVIRDRASKKLPLLSSLAPSLLASAAAPKASRIFFSTW